MSAKDVGIVQGAFDGIQDGVASGWVRDGTGEPIVVEVRVDGQDAGVVVANQGRPDLIAAGLGPCAFTFPIPDRWLDGTVHEIEFLHAESRASIFGEPDEFIAARAASDGVRTAPAKASPFLEASSDIELSVLLPTYNRADLLEPTARNLLNIIGEDPVELVVVDDGSQDQTPDILRMLKAEFGGEKLRYTSITNGGPGRARNIAAGMARGRLLMFVGDDTRATNRDLYRAHFAAHQANPSRGKAVLGKIIWPDDRLSLPNLVMSLIQGDGQQQFGYKFLKPWQTYNHWVFYTANVSVKADIVDDWEAEGFSPEFTLAAFEDAEFAYRMSKTYDDFGIYYTPNAVVEHHHPYDVEGFMRRQVSCGLMMDVLLRKHPELSKDLLGEELARILSSNETGHNLRMPSNHYSSMIEGIRSWALVLDEHYGLGSQNWHADVLNAVFRMSLFDGYLMLQSRNPVAQAAGYRHVLEDFRAQIGRAVSTEVLGDVPGFGLI